MKSIKYRIRGFVWGVIASTVFWGAVAYPHTTYHISTGNQPPEQQLALDQSAVLAKTMPKVK